MALTKSQRVKLISQIAKRLHDEEWTPIDLVLNQFGFPTSDNWSGSKESYVIEMIKSSEDGDLIEIAEHFGIQEVQPSDANAPPKDTPYWQEGKLRVFISHLTQEKQTAADIQDVLSRYGIASFVAHTDIHPTKEWQIEIETALSTCDLLVALIHPDFIGSQWCDQEIGYALGRGIPVFTIRCGADPHGFVGRFQAFTGTGKTPAQIGREIFDATLTHKALQKRMGEVLMGLFERSGSFAAAKARIKYLEGLSSWETTYIDRLENALENNDQISGSWGVPGQVAALLKKWKAG